MTDCIFLQGFLECQFVLAFGFLLYYCGRFINCLIFQHQRGSEGSRGKKTRARGRGAEGDPGDATETGGN